MQGNANLRYAIEEDSSFIVRYFEDFYGEVIRQKSLVLGHPTIKHAEELDLNVEVTDSYTPDLSQSVKPVKNEKSKVEDGAAQSPPSVQQAALPEQIISRLIVLLNSQALDATRYGGQFAAKYYKEAEFIMAALADEIFLHIDWSGKDYWEKNLLESRLYGTHKAGEEFFDRIEEFLKNRDPSRADLAMVYLLALGLGFRGKYRNMDDQGRLAHYRRELFIYINHRDPILFEIGSRLFPEEYQHTVEDAKVSYLNDLKPWLIVFAAIGLVFLFASYVVWTATTYSVSRLTGSIITQTEES